MSKRRPAFFHGFWRDPATGMKWRATRAELGEAARLWWRYREIREGRA